MSRTLEGRVRDMAGADGVLETKHGVVFVPLVVPGDVVRVRARKRGKQLRGEVLEVLEPSADRREAPCSIVEQCGGCPWMPIGDDAQRTIKRARVAELGVEVQWHDASATAYRHRARLAFRGSLLGYRQRRGRQVVDATRCVVLDAARAAAWTRIRTLADVLRGEGEILLGPHDDAAVALVRTDSPQPPDLYVRCSELLDEHLRGIALQVAGARASWGVDHETYVVDGAALRSPVGGFAQGHGVLNETLVQYVGSQVPDGSSVLELYCGAGNLSVRLARSASRWTGIESDADAAGACRANLEARRLDGRVVQGDAGTFGSEREVRVEAVVLDPPRSGARDACARIPDTRAQHVVYVSCHLATLKRDLAMLRDGGYRLQRCAAFDMFPQTPHLEVVATLRRS